MRITLATNAASASLKALREQIERIEAGRVLAGEEGAPGVATGWGLIDGALPGGGLRRGAVHEWIGLAEDPGAGGSSSDGWTPALSVLQHLAQRSIGEERGTWLAWVGRAVWPSGHALMRADAGLIERSLFVDAPDSRARLWAIDLVLRSEAFACVVADGSGLTTAATRRLQLAAEEGGSLGHLARPPNERRTLSAASTRWLLTRRASAEEFQRWSVELLRCKGAHPDPRTPTSWMLDRDHETGRIGVSAQPVVRRASSEEAAGALGADHSQDARRTA